MVKLRKAVKTELLTGAAAAIGNGGGAAAMVPRKPGIGVVAWRSAMAHATPPPSEWPKETHVFESWWNADWAARMEYATSVAWSL